MEIDNAQVHASGTAELRDVALPSGRRIVVVGTSGSGKSTLARTLAARLGLQHVELDALHWGPNWTPIEREALRARVVEALAAPAWVVDGNYSMLRDLIWPRAETLIWLDYSLPLVLARVTRRTFWRLVWRETLWGGNREQLRNLFRSDSIILWALKTHAKHRRLYPALLAEPAHAHLTFVRLRSPRETAAWLASVASPAANRA
jgi:adenylate kinase family enzyme